MIVDILFLILGVSTIYLSQNTKQCCYYRQHFHNAYCNNNSGCIITEALIEGPPKVFCSITGDCLPPEAYQGYWLEGFTKSCSECNF